MKNTLVLPTMRGYLDRMIDSPFNSFIDNFFNDTLPLTLFRDQDTFPRYNIRRLLAKEQESKEGYNVITYDKNGFVIELALAGWNKNAFEVYTEKGTLVVKSCCQFSDNDDSYIRKGIAVRDFVWKMNLPKYAEITNTSYENGLLSIQVEVKVPEEQQRKIIEIK